MPEPLRLSASQLETYNLCARKWWFQKVRGLKEPMRGNLSYGTVIHAVIERFLRADDQGNDPATGLPVDLFPEGWETAEGRDGKPGGRVSATEADQIRRLIAKAIEEGVLERRPGRMVEQEFEAHLTDGPDGEWIGFKGFIDYCYLYADEAAVQDHKSSKNTKYLKSPKALSENLQLLLYAKVVMMMAEERGLPVPETVSLRHNGYVKEGAGAVRKTEIRVSRERVEDHWNKLKTISLRVLNTRKATQWFEVPDPTNPREACNAYGGCPFLLICNGSESPEHYEKRMASADLPPVKFTATGGVSLIPDSFTLPAAPSAAIPSSHKETVMALSAAELIAQKRAKAAGTSAPATQAGFMPPPGQALTPAPKAGPAFAVLSAASQAAGHILPPWATAQSGTLGFNKDGTIDQVAAQIAAEANLPGPEYFAVEIKDGCAHWTTGPEVSDNEDFLNALMGLGLKPSGVTPLTLDWTPPVVAAKEVVKQAVFSFGKKAPAPVAEVAPAPTPEPVAEATPAAVVPEAPKPAKKAKTLPAPALISNIGKADFILYVNCFPVGQKALPISELLVAIGKQMAEQYKKPFYEIDAFARRDSISANADKVLAFVAKAGVDVVVDVNSPDARTVVDALRPYASTVVEAIAR